MSVYPKRPCTATTKKGNLCKAWATHGSDPALCSAHAGRNKGAGAPAGNTNAVKHGFYRNTFSPEELADLLAYAGDMTLEDELAVTRVLLRRIFQYLTNTTLYDPQDLAAVAPLVFSGTRTVAHLLRQMEGEESPLDRILNEVLDEMAETAEIPL